MFDRTRGRGGARLALIMVVLLPWITINATGHLRYASVSPAYNSSTQKSVTNDCALY